MKARENLNSAHQILCPLRYQTLPRNACFRILGETKRGTYCVCADLPEPRLKPDVFIHSVSPPPFPVTYLLLLITHLEVFFHGNCDLSLSSDNIYFHVLTPNPWKLQKNIGLSPAADQSNFLTFSYIDFFLQNCKAWFYAPKSEICSHLI